MVKPSEVKPSELPLTLPATLTLALPANTPSAQFSNSTSAAASEAVLTLDAMSYQLGDQMLLEEISLSITTGSRHVILGPNGAGKSVLLRLMHGLLSPSHGRLMWGESGHPPKQAMVFQRPVMLRRSARDNIVFALQVAQVQGDLKRIADQALERVGLSGLADRAARLCSIGEQQRLALARAWAVDPELLFLDEPSASLDPSATRHVEAIINAMHANGTTIVMASHDLGQARRLADQVCFLHQGRLIESCSASSFFSEASSPLAQAFLNGELLWEAP
jgi:tungstate transport system ATP-binding protein